MALCILWTMMVSFNWNSTPWLSYQWFSQVPSGSHRFSLVLIGSQWFSQVLSGSHRFLVVLIGSQWFPQVPPFYIQGRRSVVPNVVKAIDSTYVWLMILGVLFLLSIDTLCVNIAGVNMVNVTNLAHAYYVVTPYPLPQSPCISHSYIQPAYIVQGYSSPTINYSHHTCTTSVRDREL